MNKIINHISLLWFLCTCGCTPSNSDDPPAGDLSPSAVSERVRVETVVIKREAFYAELLANGKLSAPRKARMRFRTEGLIAEVAVREGEYVQQGQLIARLDDLQTRRGQQGAELHLRQTRIDYEDLLLRSGYRLADTTRMSIETKAALQLRSGLSKALMDMKNAEADLNDTRLTAPFSGKIAGLKASAFNSSSSYDQLCMLIDDSRLEVTFQVLEQELPFVRAAGHIAVAPYSDPSANLTGRITGISPLVDAAGMVEVRASLPNAGGKLMDGMNVRVRVRRQLPATLVVPREAVLDRQGRKVVFTLVSDSMAKWNYVEPGAANSTHFSIEKGLQQGDEVIYKGNFNLAHDKVVTRSQPQ